MGISVTASVNLSNETLANLVRAAAHLKMCVYKRAGLAVLWATNRPDHGRSSSGID